MHCHSVNKVQTVSAQQRGSLLCVTMSLNDFQECSSFVFDFRVISLMSTALKGKMKPTTYILS